MGTDSELHEAQDLPAEVRCPICGELNARMRYCSHVRWTFDQGDPLDFARFAVETSPYVHARGFDSSVIPADWWQAHAEWIVAQVLARFDAVDGYVFGYLGELDMLSKDLWLEFRPDPVRPSLVRR